VKAKNQRLLLLAIALVAVLGSVLLAMSALREQAAYFYAPADLAGQPVPLGRAVRVGGMVESGSLTRLADGVTVEFRVGDGSGTTAPVRFTGILPDLFKEAGGVVAEGRFREDGTFVADEILAKHDENYMPPEAAGNRHKTASLE
jgi:cytochrome c-type biogenesis protein CcmE